MTAVHLIRAALHRCLLLTDLDDEVPPWVAEYRDSVDKVVTVSCSLRTLSWASSFKYLTELNADGNRIASLTGCTELPKLRTLSLNFNVITNLNGLLGHCSVNFPELTLLSLLGNPCCPSEVIGYSASEYMGYVRKVSAALPTLRFLDHVALDTSGRRTTEIRVFDPLKEAMSNLRSRQFTRAVKDLGKVVINAAMVGKELGTDVSFSVSSIAGETAKEFIQSAKAALLNAAPSAAAAALSESDQLQILQKQVLPQMLEHDGAAVIAELTGLYAAGDIDTDEYRRLLRLNGEMQQETAEINRSNTIRALEEFESYVFPEASQSKRELSTSEDHFSKGMRDSGLEHVSFNNVVTRLTHDQLPPELDLSNTTMLDAAAVDVPEEELSATPTSAPNNSETPTRKSHIIHRTVEGSESCSMTPPKPRAILAEISPLRDTTCRLDDEFTPPRSLRWGASSCEDAPMVNIFTQENDLVQPAQ